MKKIGIKGLKKLTVTLCTLSIASGVLLGACGSAEKNESETSTQETVTKTDEVTTTSERDAETMMTGLTESETEETESTVTHSSESDSTESPNTSEVSVESVETIKETNPPEWVVDEETGMLIDNSNFIVEDSNGVEHVMTREQYKQWLNGEYSWE